MWDMLSMYQGVCLNIWTLLRGLFSILFRYTHSSCPGSLLHPKKSGQYIYKRIKKQNWGRGGEQAGQEVRMDHPGVGSMGKQCYGMYRGGGICRKEEDSHKWVQKSENGGKWGRQGQRVGW